MSKLNRWLRACAIFLLWATTAIALPAQTFTTLHSFDGADGALPDAGLVQGTNGKLYGTTQLGGANGYGNVFSITTSGTLMALYSFCLQGGSCVDGSLPYVGLVQGTDGNFYGTTSMGGASGNQVDCPEGCGTVFKITSSGALTTLHSFCSQSSCPDGQFPYAGLVQGNNGMFYGTTQQGGANGYGTVFSMTPSGTLTTLHSFNGTGADGAYPQAALIQGPNRMFYGTTTYGGTNGLGTVFSITPSGALTTLHSFDGTGADGAYPPAALIQGPNGMFYGTTTYGGTNGLGTVFSITPSGALTTLHSFRGTDGANPEAGLVQGTDGNFYGTTAESGTNGSGTAFSITPSFIFTTLYNFCSQSNCTDGSVPFAALVQATNGTFYGSTSGGGANGSGTVFSLSVGLGPFVETNPASGKVGAPIRILGSNLTGATMVTFHGTPATFVVKSKSEITTTVPTGATNGLIKVVTPGGTLSSNIPFRVTP